MSWFRIDDNWADSAKVDAISDTAVRLWVICGTWCSKKENLRKFDGFVHAALLPMITKRRWTDDQLAAASNELVEKAKVGGLFEHGLWEPRDGGWYFHDWPKYRPKDSDEPSMTPSEAASIAGQASAAARAARDGTAQPRKPAKHRTVTERLPNAEKPFENSFGRTSLERLEPPDPDPVPSQRDLAKADAADSKDLTGSAQVEPVLPAIAAPAAARVETRESEPGPVNAAPRPGRALAMPPPDATSERTDRTPPSESNVARLGPIPTRRARAAGDLMTCQLTELLARCKANEFDANLTPVQTRPEVVAISDGWNAAVGLAPTKLGGYGKRNQALTVILEALEVYSPERIQVAITQAARDDWCCGRKGYERDPPRKRDVSCMSLKVLSRLLADAESSRPRCSPAVAKMLEEEQKRRSGT